MSVYSKDVQWRNDRLACKSILSEERYEGELRGKEETLIQNLRSLVSKGKTPTEAFDLLDVPEADRVKLLKMLEPEKV